MEGTLISINKDKKQVLIHLQEGNLIYQASSENLAPDAHVGDDCSFNVVKEPSLFQHGEATLLSSSPLQFTNKKTALSHEAHIVGHNTIKDDKKFLIAAEGGFEKECRSALIEKAQECHANALLDLTLECSFRPLVRGVLYRYTARPAQISGDTYSPEPGEVMSIPENTARRNSPNEAQVRYVRVLLICLLFIGIPCLLRLSERGVIPSMMLGQVLICGLIVCCMTLFMLIFFRKRKSFILALKPRRRS